MQQSTPPRRVKSIFREFISSQAAGGLVLMGVALLALVLANSSAAPAYFGVLGSHVLGLSVLHWINDALMSLFFLLVGLEIKREFLDGQLKTWPDRALPGVAALGGMLVPALIYIAFNWSTPETLRGWAIPSATDIAFALGVLALLGSRVPVSLKVFLTALAILDDLAAVVIIAIFYTSQLSWPHLLAALAVLVILTVLGRSGVRHLSIYLGLGLVLWFFVLKSGVHATLAGVALAMMIPIGTLQGRPSEAESPLLRLEHSLHPWVTFLIIPIFGFANAGVSFAGMNASVLLTPVPLGIALGLFIGKQLGVFLFAWVAIRANLAKLPASSTWPQLYGVAMLCGIGFTMSLFIGLLAFPTTPELQAGVKIGVLSGSLFSGLIGTALLIAWTTDTRHTKRDENVGSI
ncbi:sodium/proton antiporter, NhaA family [Nitrosospira multiformis]|uniref:Na(+)/H(+) antiporter NhaA n=1 Tax=Nitrosospira multiformis TaxID=1231 RepID=A0A1I0BMF7_9PROT|nr:Na+/H+ antiporter NhaA [Nitrosospira multiformis]SET08183.1 sodium/proton antiporter, NhaA family [Nitrosospira multiformis]